MGVVNGVGTINIDGKDYKLTGTLREYEDFMSIHGYILVPKEWVDSVTKQDLIDHPEKFRPYTYAIPSYCIFSYGDFANSYDYICKIWRNGINNLLLTNDHAIIWDMEYMRKRYPEFYAKLFPTINLLV